MSKAKLDEKGSEICDPKPCACPVNFRRPKTLDEKMRDIIRSEALRLEAESQGLESFEEADDFDCGDDSDPKTPYEADFDFDHKSQPGAFIEEEPKNEPKSVTAKAKKGKTDEPGKVSLPKAKAEPKQSEEEDA